jgi:hypothetical protein
MQQSKFASLGFDFLYDRNPAAGDLDGYQGKRTVSLPFSCQQHVNPAGHGVQV